MTIQFNAGSYTADRAPDECPVCGKGIRAEERTLVPRPAGFDVGYACPREECFALFIAHYVIPATGTVRGSGHRTGTLTSLSPMTPRRPQLPGRVAAVSTSFVEIYGQAMAAEAYELAEIAGAGFRKALEFLIKDYCCSQYPDKQDTIKKQFLAACIESYVDDARLKLAAKRAVWLGNDELHYVRKWAGKDLEDLKRLILLTVNWVDNGLLAKELDGDMPVSPT